MLLNDHRIGYAFGFAIETDIESANKMAHRLHSANSYLKKMNWQMPICF
ncbi:hypothetical protein ACFQ9Y_12890 [Peribacillus simplex]